MTLLTYNSPATHASCPRRGISARPTRIGTGRRRQSRILTAAARRRPGRILTAAARRRPGRILTDAARRRPGRILTGAGLVLLPWLGYLAGTLPPVEAAAWVTLDTLEAAALLITGTRLLRGAPGHRTPAAAAALLLLTDACLDLATATPGTELTTALAMAIGAELPWRPCAPHSPPARHNRPPPRTRADNAGAPYA
ncbi:hypothetical protein NCG97_25675 [Streptomyces lydicamycinicus]|uniref:hypothetical protein n=1 Tax=Streptomyces lydicamycinicus TaxID=1546107 RepID=UPI002035FC0B|nr:hypothetical protein [Streptomyces lydicamycinicus]USA03260.1 hypothetical protein NCG97_25675 [Streptomyces lydicamycinicus]